MAKPIEPLLIPRAFDDGLPPHTMGGQGKGKPEPLTAPRLYPDGPPHFTGQGQTASKGTGKPVPLVPVPMWPEE